MIVPRLFSTFATLGICAHSAADSPRFEERVIDSHAGDVVYAVTHADVDGDGSQDIVALTEDQILCYYAPDWNKTVLLDGGTDRDNVAIAPHDIDGDGRIDFALAAGWPKNGGKIHWLSRGEDGDDWKLHFVGAIPSTHRIRWADVLGKSTPQLVVSPLLAREGEDGVALTAFEIPQNPKSERWPSTVLDDSLNRMHNHWHETLTDEVSFAWTMSASQEGVHVHFPAPQSPAGFVKVKVADGATGEKPEQRGAGEIKVGNEAGEKRMFSTIEPMHGNQVVVYQQASVPTGDAVQLKFERTVLDVTLGRGHALWMADLDGDSRDEVIAGHSEPATGEIKGPGVYYYQATNADGKEWSKQVVDDGGMACEDLFVLDLTGDGKPDIVAGGRNTHNVKLYINRGE